MDTLRGEFSGPGDSSREEPQAAVSTTHDVEPGSRSPKVGPDERRMQVRAYNFWAGLLGNRTFPDIDRLNPAALPDFGPRSVLLDFSDGIENPEIVWLGEMLAQECGAQGPIRRIEDVPSRSLLSRITDHYMQILANEAPIGFEAEFVNNQNATILYRGILLPFSREDRGIDFIYGVINWKERTEPAPARAPRDADANMDERPAMLRAPEPLTDWADGPADFGLTDNLVPGYMPMDLPHPGFAPGFAANAEPTSFAQEDMGLADWLASARDLALAATRSEERSHQALYEAIGRAYDFALAAQDAPEDFAELVEDAGLKVQDRAPLIPLVKLVFGGDYDKTRLTEFATAIAHGHRLDLARGALASLLATTPGGLKAVVREERRLRREESGSAVPATAHERVMANLRTIDARPLAELAADGDEFTVLVARRLPSGEVVLVGEVSGDDGLLQRAARRLLG